MNTKISPIEIVVNGWIPESYKQMLFLFEFHVDACTKLTNSKWLVTPRKSRDESELWENTEVLKRQLMTLGYYIEMKKAS